MVEVVWSFNYAAWHTLFRADTTRPEAHGTLQGIVRRLEDLSAASFLEGYTETIAALPCHPSEEAAVKMLRLFLVEKACYEIVYESANRPNWLRVPVSGLLDMLDGKEA